MYFQWQLYQIYPNYLFFTYSISILFIAWIVSILLSFSTCVFAGFVYVAIFGIVLLLGLLVIITIVILYSIMVRNLSFSTIVTFFIAFVILVLELVILFTMFFMILVKLKLFRLSISSIFSSLIGSLLVTRMEGLWWWRQTGYEVRSNILCSPFSEHWVRGVHTVRNLNWSSEYKFIVSFPMSRR